MERKVVAIILHGIILLMGAMAIVEEGHMSKVSLNMHVPLWALRMKWSGNATFTAKTTKRLRTRSQFKEESHLVSQYFYGIGRGTFLELGALDGLRYANTYGLENDLDWHGILIEGSPASYQKMVVNRPGQLLVNSVICRNVTTVHYFDYKSGFKNPAVFGIWEFMPPGYKKLWFPDVYAGTVPIPESSAVPCVPLGYILGLFRAKHINFFSLDVEGAELDVLSSLDFNRVSFDVIVVEGQDQDVLELLESKGYVYVEELHLNRWFIRQGFTRSKK